MLASVSSQHPIQNSYVFQHTKAETEQQTNNLDKKSGDETKPETSAAKEVTPSQKDLQQIQQLKNRDREVKAHEQAHLNAAGVHATSGTSFSYTTGPNGVRYATAGEVNVDTSPVSGDPSATLRKADAVRRAALAPANPSSQDRLVASKASSMAQEAKMDLLQLTQKENKESKMTEKNNEGDVDANKISKPSSADIGSLLDFSV